MIPAVDRYGRRSLVGAAVFAVVLLVFVTGAQRQARRIGVLGPAQAEIRARAIERARQVEAWDPATPEEEVAYERMAQRLQAVLPATDTRMAASARLTKLAEQCGLREVTLLELYEQTAPGSSFGDMYDEYEEDEGEGAGGWVKISQSDAGDLRVQRFEFEMTFLGSYPAVMTFLRELGRDEVLIEVREMVVTRAVPWLRVELILAAYGRGA